MDLNLKGSTLSKFVSSVDKLESIEFSVFLQIYGETVGLDAESDNNLSSIWVPQYSGSWTKVLFYCHSFY